MHTKSARYFLKGKKMPDLIILPVDHTQMRKDASYLEKILFHREASKGTSRLLVVSKGIIKKVGGFDASLGFGEDRLYQDKIFKLFGIDEQVIKDLNK